MQKFKSLIASQVL